MVRRNVFLSFCAVVVCIFALTAVVGAEKTTPETLAGQIQKLQERVSQLEDRVKTLEQKQQSGVASYALPGGPTLSLPPNAALPNGSKTDQFFPNGWVPTLPNGLDQSVPNGWVPRQFNGQTYYIVPLGGDQK